MPPELVAFLRTIGLCFMGGEDRYEQLEQAGEVVRITLPFPSPKQRAAIWEQTFEAMGARLADDMDLPEIGRKLALDAQRIQAAARAALSAAAVRAQSHGG